MLCEDDVNNCGRIVRIDEHRWYIPSEKYIDRPGVWWASPGGMSKAGQIFDSKTLKLQTLPLEMPRELEDRYRYNNPGTARSIVALAPDDQGAAWFAIKGDDDGSSKGAGQIIVATPPSTLRHIDLPPEWLKHHPFPDNASWPGDDHASTTRPLSEVPQTQQWFNQFFRWEKDANGVWTVQTNDFVQEAR